MEGEIKLEDVFAQRLALLQPTRADLRRIAQAYRAEIVPGARDAMAAWRFAGYDVYVVSGGLLPAIQNFMRTLGLPP
jgi:phosphoserine phosphatase